jgi:hypothetical protein
MTGKVFNDAGNFGGGRVIGLGSVERSLVSDSSPRAKSGKNLPHAASEAEEHQSRDGDEVDKHCGCVCRGWIEVRFVELPDQVTASSRLSRTMINAMLE